MVAKIITVANQKGGAGKTTLAMQLAGTLALRGKRVLVVDGDKQGSATRWAANADDDSSFPAQVVNLAEAGKTIHREVKRFLKDFEIIIIDCPPSVESPIPQSALVVSDIALIPIIPSPNDFWATRGIKQLIEHAQAVNEGLQAFLVPNMCQMNTNLAQEILELLEDFGLPLFPVSLHLRTGYRESAGYGQTVHIFRSKQREAISEIERLTDRLEHILENHHTEMLEHV